MSDMPVSPDASHAASEFLLRGDPVISWLPRRRWGTSAFLFLVVVWGLLHGLGLPWLYGHWRTFGGILGAWDDWPMQVILLVMVPAIVAYYARQPAIIHAMQSGVLERAKVNALAEGEAKELARWLGWPGWTWTAVGVGILQVFSSINDFRHLAVPTWESVNGVMIWTLEPLRFITFYMLVLILVRHVLTLINLNHLITTLPIEIAPLHPNSAGGLRAVGDYVFSFGLLAMVVSLNFGMTLLRGREAPGVLTTEFYGELSFYLLAAPLLFFLPLWNVHTRMAAARKRLLAEIAEQFDQEYRALFDNLRRNVLEPESVSRLEAVQKIYHIAHAAPEWPFDLTLMSKAGAVVFLPILAPLGVNLLINWLSSR
jgi:hypothetical protein